MYQFIMNIKQSELSRQPHQSKRLTALQSQSRITFKIGLMSSTGRKALPGAPDGDFFRQSCSTRPIRLALLSQGLYLKASF